MDAKTIAGHHGKPTPYGLATDVVALRQTVHCPVFPTMVRDWKIDVLLLSPH
jgi:hypothetical protein